MRITYKYSITLYAGFGPGNVNIFRNMLGLPQTEWKEVRDPTE